ncbi:FG-GAP repeat domain-containing protein [Tenacibaculum agarivorans]|uniref:FG-GAP repeat domain-containing protein n=1 Tax=Tenacibaculum agarivorans TaxID=1908389 RepID=UPI00094BA235|nr:VCBS repeat-containing protein [Tenacibaculum agarivorans]
MKIKITIVLLLTLLNSYSQKEGKFTFELKQTPIIQVAGANTRFFDYDLDGDLDLIISGNNEKTEGDVYTLTKLYLNDGKGNFSEDKRSKLMGVEYGKIDIGDINKDGYLDIVITGQEVGSNKERRVIVYQNNKGVFKPVKEITTFRTFSMFAGFANVNNDGYDDLCIERDMSIEYYINDTKGDFKLAGTLLGAGNVFEYGIVPFDIDNDGYDEVLLQGEELIYTSKRPEHRVNTILFKNTKGKYKSIPHNFRGTNQGVIQPVDIDDDGDLDVFITNTGKWSEKVEKSFFYMNDKGSFKEIEANITRYNLGRTCFADFDNDEDKDLIIIGNRKVFNTTSYYTEAMDIYENKEGKFSLFKEKAFPFLDQSSISAADIDGDGDLDILITGYKIDIPITRVYINTLK